MSVMISTAREVLREQIQLRFVEKLFSPARLIQIYMSKQMEASKVLSEQNLANARALYSWFRALRKQGCRGL